MSIYKRCDIRGRFGDELTVDHAYRLGLAISTLHEGEDILVGGDGRCSTPLLKEHLIAGLIQGGCRVLDVGMLPTPAFYFARYHLGIERGIQVTASHNPAEDNGFKIVLDPEPITSDALRQIEGLMRSEKPTSSGASGSVEEESILPAYVGFAREQAPRLDGVRIVIDCANGMAGLVAQTIWAASAAEVSLLYDNIDGTFPNHSPNPADVANLKSLAEATIAFNGDLGVAYDGDADRVAFVDGLGQPISSDHAIVIFARQALQKAQTPIVYDQKCSRIVAETILRHGGVPIMEQSGHTFIKSAFLRHGASYAGELSGHHFFEQLRGDDGVIASLYMAGILQREGKSLAEICAAIPSYPITPEIRMKIDAGSAKPLLETLNANFRGRAKVDIVDGVRVEFEDAWGLVRESVTEPSITMRFEGLTEHALQTCIARFMEAEPKLSPVLEKYMEQSAGEGPNR